MATTADLKSSDGEMIIRSCVERRFPVRHHYKDQILCELVASSIVQHPDLLTPLSFEWRSKEADIEAICAHHFVWARVEKLIDQLNWAIASNLDEAQALRRWNMQPTSKLDQSKEVDESANLDELSSAYRDYRQGGWAESPSLEIWLVQKMIFAEVFAYAREVGIPPSKTMITWTWGKSLIKWGIGVAVAVSVGEQHGAALGILVYVLWLCALRFFANDYIEQLTKKSSAFAAMRHCYVLAIRTSPCPAEISDALIRAENVLAVWPEELRSLVERQLVKRRDLWA